MRQSLEGLGCALFHQDGSGVGPDTDVVCVSTAIEESNGDIAAASARGLSHLAHIAPICLPLSSHADRNSYYCRHRRLAAGAAIAIPFRLQVHNWSECTEETTMAGSSDVAVRFFIAVEKTQTTSVSGPTPIHPHLPKRAHPSPSRDWRMGGMLAALGNTIGAGDLDPLKAQILREGAMLLPKCP